MVIAGIFTTAICVIDYSIFNQPVNADDSIRIRAIADLTDEEWQSVLDYVNYVRTKRKV